VFGIRAQLASDLITQRSQRALFEDVGTATFDPTRQYRYTLTRCWDASGPRIMWLLCNPSTADENVLDPTLKRCYKWSLDLGYGSFEVTNMFAYRSTDPRGLRSVEDPVGPENDEAILGACGRASMVVLGWGDVASVLGQKFDQREQQLTYMLWHHHVTTYALAVTGRTRRPRHPLYLRSSCRPTRWP